MFAGYSNPNSRKMVVDGKLTHYTYDYIVAVKLWLAAKVACITLQRVLQ